LSQLSRSLFLFSLLTFAAAGHLAAQSIPQNVCVAAPPLDLPNKNIINVSSSRELERAIKNLRDGTTVLISPGTYKLKSTIAITADNVTVRGVLNNCNAVQLIGPGMKNSDHRGAGNGFWISATNTLIANLTISEVYFHTITIDGTSSSPRIYNVRMINSGQQFVKVNPREFGQGVDNGIVEYSVMEYTDGPPMTDHNNSGTGYTNGIDIHAGSNWRISNNRFSNFHTPDHADHLSNAAVLVWNGAKGTITENNVFIDVDRSIAYGLEDKGNDHQGGIIRNNMIVMAPELYSDKRKKYADASIVVWDSPGTRVLHNTILTSGNTPGSIELRFDTSGAEVSNNLTDAPITHRNNNFFLSTNNLTNAKPGWFFHPPSGNLHLRPETSHNMRDKVRRHRLALLDIDGEARPFGRNTDIGADEHNAEPSE